MNNTLTQDISIEIESYMQSLQESRQKEEKDKKAQKLLEDKLFMLYEKRKKMQRQHSNAINSIDEKINTLVKSLENLKTNEQKNLKGEQEKLHIELMQEENNG